MRILVNFHKILLKFTKIRMDFQLTNFFGEFYMIFSLSVYYAKQIWSVDLFDKILLAFAVSAGRARALV
jgi:hypothetical protein